MKKSELKQIIKEEIKDVLGNSLKNDIINIIKNEIYLKDIPFTDGEVGLDDDSVEDTADAIIKLISKKEINEISGNTKQPNDENEKTILKFIKSIANKYDYSEEDAALNVKNTINKFYS